MATVPVSWRMINNTSGIYIGDTQTPVDDVEFKTALQARVDTETATRHRSAGADAIARLAALSLGSQRPGMVPMGPLPIDRTPAADTEFPGKPVGPAARAYKTPRHHHLPPEFSSPDENSSGDE